MLKNIPSILSPDLLKTLMEMGHGDEIVIGDGNFPAASIAKAASTAKAAGASLLRCDGHDVPSILEAIMQLFPLDKHTPKPAFLMDIAAQDKGKIPVPGCWSEYEEIILGHEPKFDGFAMVERFAFYEQAKRCYAVVATGETAIYANIILKKGVL